MGAKKLYGTRESPRKPTNVKDLIQSTTLLRNAAAQFYDAQRQWQDFLASRLDAALFARIAGIGAAPRRLTIYAESSAWSARLRYALADLEPAIRARDPSITCVEVRVRPAGMPAIRKSAGRR